MDLFRVFTWDGNSLDDSPGGPFHVPRSRQGSGRHDNPEIYGAIYTATGPVCAIAEAIQPFRSQTLAEEDLQRLPDRRLALAMLEVSEKAVLVDLDNPHELAARNFRPSQVADSNRESTRAQAKQIFQEGLGGLLWWSTIEASWINCTLFAERAESFLSLKGGLHFLTLSDPRLAAAARRLGVNLAWIIHRFSSRGAGSAGLTRRRDRGPRRRTLRYVEEPDGAQRSQDG